MLDPRTQAFKDLYGTREELLSGIQHSHQASTRFDNRLDNFQNQLQKNGLYTQNMTEEVTLRRTMMDCHLTKISQTQVASAEAQSTIVQSITGIRSVLQSLRTREDGLVRRVSMEYTEQFLSTTKAIDDIRTTLLEASSSAIQRAIGANASKSQQDVTTALLVLSKTGIERFFLSMTIGEC